MAESKGVMVYGESAQGNLTAITAELLGWVDSLLTY